MISYAQAAALIRQTAGSYPLATESIPLERIDGRICAEQVDAPIALQPFTNAAMDGYAVRYHDCNPTSLSAAPTLHILTTVAAGDTPAPRPLTTGECAIVLTGAPLPPGADTVIPFEHAERKEQQIEVHQLPKSSGANVRQAGEDFAVDAPVLQPGTQLDTTHLMPLAALGIKQVRVYCRPKAALITTGNELTHTLGASLAPGQIYNSTYYYGQAALQRLGCEVIHRIHIRDELEGFMTTTRQFMDEDVDLLVSSGAVSAGGKSDFVRAGLEKIGAEILFHKIAIRPGKPALLARLPNGALYFGLPGNPLATAVGLRLLLAPAIRAMTQLEEERPTLARLANPFDKKADFSVALLSTAQLDHEQRLCVDVPHQQGSFMTRAALAGNCWALLSPEFEHLESGERVETYPLWPGAKTSSC